MRYLYINIDTEVAPLWCPEKKTFLALMTISDYIRALQICRTQGVTVADLSLRSINGNNNFNFNNLILII
jgi:hypothetical protein